MRSAGWRGPVPRLVVVTDTDVAPPERLVERVGRLCAACRPGSVLVQLRDREIPARARLRLGERLLAAAREHGQLFGVNDRADFVGVLGADVLHLGEHSVSTADARTLVGDDVLVTRACHDPDVAAAEGSDGVVLSPVLAARKGNPALGLEGLGRARAALDTVPAGSRPLLFALGGVDHRGAASCIAAGADGIAAIGAVIGRDDASDVVAALGIGR